MNGIPFILPENPGGCKGIRGGNSRILKRFWAESASASENTRKNRTIFTNLLTNCRFFDYNITIRRNSAVSVKFI